MQASRSTSMVKRSIQMTEALAEYTNRVIKPEHATAAIVVHHPQSSYFAVREVVEAIRT
jgi:cobalamin-dependent methionine synthase I